MVAASLAMLALMVAASVLAYRRLPPSGRLPMQWGVRGKVNWTAPRAVALAFTPVLAAVLLGLAALFPRQDAGDERAPLILMALCLGVHLVHLALVRRHLLRRAS